MANYTQLALEARREVLGLIHRAGTSHIASNFSVIDIATVLNENLKPEDEVVWSSGWKAATIYYFLWKQGKITREQLDSFPNPPFLGLAEVSVPGVHVSGGSMGQGLGVAIGMALARKREGKPGIIYCIMSDGEMQEGTTWEGAQLAGQHHLNNLVVLIDYNKWTAMGKTKDVADVEPFMEKWAAFRWNVVQCDGHNYERIEDALTTDIIGINFGNIPQSFSAVQVGGSYGDESLRWCPRVIICDTIKGKGVKMFEDKILFHYAHVDKPTYDAALKELA